MTNNIAKIRAALESALARATSGSRVAELRDAIAALAELERAAPQFVAGEVTQEMCKRVAASFYGADTFANGVEMREALQLWRKELGPALGLVEIREPTPEECKQICTEYERLLMREGTCGGRDAFDACRAVLWPKEGL